MSRCTCSSANEKVTALEMVARVAVRVGQTTAHAWLESPCERASLGLRQRAAIVAVCLAAAQVNSHRSVITGERIASKIITEFSWANAPRPFRKWSARPGWDLFTTRWQRCRPGLIKSLADKQNSLKSDLDFRGGFLQYPRILISANFLFISQKCGRWFRSSVYSLCYCCYVPSVCSTTTSDRSWTAVHFQKNKHLFVPPLLICATSCFSQPLQVSYWVIHPWELVKFSSRCNCDQQRMMRNQTKGRQRLKQQWVLLFPSDIILR